MKVFDQMQAVTEWDDALDVCKREANDRGIAWMDALILASAHDDVDESNARCKRLHRQVNEWYGKTVL